MRFYMFDFLDELEVFELSLITTGIILLLIAIGGSL